MENTKNRAAPVEEGRPWVKSGNESTTSLLSYLPSVRKSRGMEGFQAQRMALGLTPGDIVQSVTFSYPRFDRYLLSKCERGNYGITLTPEAFKAVYEYYPQMKPQEGQKRDGHRLTCRVSCRLETWEYEALQQLIKESGYDTTQAWLAKVIRGYLRRRKKSERL